jgi:DNA-binding SARP family transcriptional activator
MYIGVATDAASEGRVEEATQMIGEGLASARELGSEVDEALLLVTLADLYSDSGRPESSLGIYERADQLLDPSGEENWRTYVSFRKAVALRRAGRDRTRILKSQSSRPNRLKRAWGGEWAAELAMDNAHEDLGYSLRRLSRLATKGSSAILRILVMAHYAQILAERGETTEAASKLDKCLRLADECGMPALLAGELGASSDLRSLGRRVFSGNPRWIKVEEILELGRRLPEVVSGNIGMAEARSPLVIEALGRVSVVRSGNTLGLKRKPLEVLLFIADRGSVPRDALVDAFWGHLDPKKQAANLHSALYSLRKTLGKPAITVSNGLISFGKNFEIEYEVSVFLRESNVALSMDWRQPGRLGVLQRAADLYAGAFAPTVDSGWALARRAGLQDVFSDLVLAFGETALSDGLARKATPYLRRALEGDPYREDLAAMLVRCLRASGRKAEALHFASQFASLHLADLGLPTGPDLAEQIAQLRKHEEPEGASDAGYLVSAYGHRQ